MPTAVAGMTAGSLNSAMHARFATFLTFGRQLALPTMAPGKTTDD